MTVGTRLVSLFSLSSLAVLLCSFTASPVTALSVEVAHSARSLHARGHDALAKRKRSAKKTKRCKPKSKSTSQKATPSPAPASAPAPQNQGYVGGGGSAPQLGLAWANGPEFLQYYTASRIMYTWAPACPSNAKSLGIKCCPMLWGYDQIGQFQQVTSSQTPECAMGFNEPEIPSQSNISPEAGAQLWNKYIAPLGTKGAELISPATTSDDTDGTWLSSFGKACNGDETGLCGAHILALHWYDVDPANLIAYLERLHAKFNKPVWLTEFACQNFNGGPQCSPGQVDALQAQIIQFVKKNPWMTIFPFSFMQNMQGVNDLNRGMNSDGTPNAFGRTYLNM